MNFENDEKFKYVLEFIDYSIIQYIEDVITDSESDPEYSAVTLNNLMICYIHFLQTVRINVSNSVKELFISYGYSDKDFDDFEYRRKKESNYYIGKQFVQDGD